MRRTFKIATGLLIGILLVVVVPIVVGWVGPYVDRRHNTKYTDSDAPIPSDAELALHRSLFIVDLHADTMMWDRDLLERSDYGHVDLPRLIDGNVAVQVFVAVTKTPPKEPAPAGALLPDHEAIAECFDADGFNRTGWLQVVQLRPVATWFDLEARAFYQAERLRGFVAGSERRHAEDPRQPVLRLILSVGDLREVVQRRLAGEPVVGAVLALEGAHWIGGAGADEASIREGVERLQAAGFRILGPIHQFQNDLGASSEGCDQLAGLTQHGRIFLDEAEKRGIILDLAHGSDESIREATEARAAPVVVSHTGVRETCEPAAGCEVERNMRDSDIRAVARTGGVIAIGYWPEATGRGVARIAAAFASAHRALSDSGFVEEMSADGTRYDPFEHIALGSDFDGDTAVPFDAGGLATLTAALTRYRDGSGKALFDEPALRRIMGANACRVLALRLPDGGPAAAREICGPLLHGSGDSRERGRSGPTWCGSATPAPARDRQTPRALGCCSAWQRRRYAAGVWPKLALKARVNCAWSPKPQR
jgi:microsomal dipeptidase-like Zn-dependent dipeptidase